MRELRCTDCAVYRVLRRWYNDVQWIPAACARIAGRLSRSTIGYALTAMKRSRRARFARRTRPDLGGFIPHSRFYHDHPADQLRPLRRHHVFSMRAETRCVHEPGLPDPGFVRRQVDSASHGGSWRLVTAGFLHGGIMHILMNSWVLFDLGAQVEEDLRHEPLLVFYFVSTVGGFYASTVWSPVISVGAVGRSVRTGRRHDRARCASSQRQGSAHSRHVSAMGGHRPGLRNGGGFSTWTTQPTSAAWRRDLGSPLSAGTPGRVGIVENIWRAAGWFCLLMTAVSFLKMYLWFAASTQ